MQHADYQILDTIAASVYWKDLEGKYLGCNKYMLDMAGLKSRDEILGKTDYDNMLPWHAVASEVRKLDQLVINNIKKYEFEDRGKIADGSERVLLSTKSPLLDKEGRVIGVIGVSIDITHHKKVEEEFAKTEESLSEYSQIKNRFLRNISHESRIPIGSVLSIADSLYSNWDQYDEETKKESAGLILKEAQRISQFILNIFDVSKFIKGEMQPNFVRCNFTKLVQDIAIDYKKSFCSDKINIEVTSDEEYHLVFDKNLIKKVLENLLMNAVQYCPQEKNITINIERGFLKNGVVPTIICKITDKGIGVPPAELDTIFNFFAESSRTASKAQGRGLGLSICREIVDLHAGEIWVENNSNNAGASFYFSIPTSLFAISNKEVIQENKNQDRNKIIYRDLHTIYLDAPKEPFALVVISPFNSYFSAEKILEICEWVNLHYEEFAIFFPDKISKYTLEAMGYDESEIHQKVRKQDNHTMNRIHRALEEFYQKHPDSPRIKIHTISELKEDKLYSNLYKIYIERFFRDKLFRQSCLEIADWVVSKSNKDDSRKGDFHKDLGSYIAVNYFLYELPITINTADILKVKSSDWVYHTIPDCLKWMCSDSDLVPSNQRFLVLK
jgi:tRNA-dependent cyclodipeptide synthase